MKGACVVALLAVSVVLPAAAQDGVKFYAERWALLEMVELKPADDGVLVAARGSSEGLVSATLVDPKGTEHALDLQRDGDSFVLEARAPGGPWVSDGLHMLVFEGSGAHDEVPVELKGGALAPGFGTPSDGVVVFETWSMLRSASVESRGGIDVAEVVAETGRTAPVSVMLRAPDGSSSVLESVEPRAGQYSFSTAVGGPLWSQDGDYTLIFEQPGNPPYFDELILPVSGGAVALPAEPVSRDVKVSEKTWLNVEEATASADSLWVRGSADEPLDVRLLSPDGVSVALGTIEPDADGSFEASYDLSGSTGAPGAYAVQFGDGGDVLIAYIGLPGSGGEPASMWTLIETAEAISGEPDVLWISGSAEQDAPISVMLVTPAGDERALQRVLPSGGTFAVRVPVIGWAQDGVYTVVLEQPGNPPQLDAFPISAESNSIVRAGYYEVKSSGARWSAVTDVSITPGPADSIRVSAESDADLSARVVSPSGGSTDLPVERDGRLAVLELDASGDPWGESGTYAVVLEGEGVRDSVPVIMDGRNAAPGFAQDGELQRWTLIGTASVSRSGDSDVLSVRGESDGRVSVSLTPPGGAPADLGEASAGGPFEFELPVRGSMWSRDGVYAVSFEQDDPPERDVLYLDVREGSVVPEFGAAVWVLAAAAGAGAAARRLRA